LIFSDSDSGTTLAYRGRTAGLDTCTVPAHSLVEGDAGLIDVLEAWRPDMLHIHAGIAVEGHGAAAAARAVGIPAIVRTEHLPYTLRKLGKPALEALYAHGVRPVDRIICVCAAARQTFGMADVDPARYAVIHNGILLRKPMRARAAVRAELGFLDNPLILTVARFSEQKRHATLVDALPALLKTLPDKEVGDIHDLANEIRQQLGKELIGFPSKPFKNAISDFFVIPFRLYMNRN
jgi:glycosyltransferase involved in cell wall biosynthesis